MSNKKKNPATYILFTFWHLAVQNYLLHSLWSQWIAVLLQSILMEYSKYIASSQNIYIHIHLRCDFNDSINITHCPVCPDTFWNPMLQITNMDLTLAQRYWHLIYNKPKSSHNVQHLNKSEIKPFNSVLLMKSSFGKLVLTHLKDKQ